MLKVNNQAHLRQNSNVIPLSYLQFWVHFLLVVGHGKDGICALKSRLGLALIIDVSSNSLDTPGLESFGVWLRGVSGDASYFELIGGL